MHMLLAINDLRSLVGIFNFSVVVEFGKCQFTHSRDSRNLLGGKLRRLGFYPPGVFPRAAIRSFKRPSHPDIELGFFIPCRTFCSMQVLTKVFDSVKMFSPGATVPISFLACFPVLLLNLKILKDRYM